ncbi:MAG TPA: hypothetical protein PL157_11535 [Acidobacteriota bacterium]|nr:hypothetical protein [Acidobacteriota bacterium]HNH82997.1 hypothetical protein [Acidobacteriota bacterium]
MEMPFDYVTRIGTLAAEDRLRFYELFAHNLTIGIRVIWSEPAMTDSEKLDQIKWINEILHQVISKAFHLRVNQNTRTESDTWDTIQHWISQNPAIGGHVRIAIRFSYNNVAKINDISSDPLA